MAEVEAAIVARGLAKTFHTRHGPVPAVAGIDLAVAPGETFGLIGPDGAGKSTTVRTILGLLERTAGESSILGYDSLRDTYAIRERVGYIAQQFALPPDLTVLENMRFFARVNGLGRRRQRERIEALLAFAGLEAFGKRRAAQLSGGMRKKLALACSLIHEPAVVMLDEPTLGVDPASRREFWDLLGNLRAERGMTIFVCTPYMDEAERCSRVGLIYRGRLIACDTPRAIKGLVRGELLQFTPTESEGARAVVEGLAGVREIQSYGRMLHVFVDDAEQRREEMVAALEQEGIGVQGMRRIEPRMEEAFISLVRRERGRG